MGRSFSFSTAWGRNQRHHDYLERTAGQLANEFGFEDQAQAMPVQIGDRPAKRLITTEGRHRSGMEDVPFGLGEEMTHKGQRVVTISEEYQRDRDTYTYTYSPEEGGTFQTTWERDAKDGQWTISRNRRVFE